MMMMTTTAIVASVWCRWIAHIRFAFYSLIISICISYYYYYYYYYDHHNTRKKEKRRRRKWMNLILNRLFIELLISIAISCCMCTYHTIVICTLSKSLICFHFLLWLFILLSEVNILIYVYSNLTRYSMLHFSFVLSRLDGN